MHAATANVAKHGGREGTTQRVELRGCDADVHTIGRRSEDAVTRVIKRHRLVTATNRFADDDAAVAVLRKRREKAATNVFRLRRDEAAAERPDR